MDMEELSEKNGELAAIRESKDCSAEEQLIQEINTGIYLVDSSFLAPALRGLKNENSQKEYYLTDIVEKAVSEGQRVCSLLAPDFRECIGVNTLEDLTEVNAILRSQRIAKFQRAGVTFCDPTSVNISCGVTIGTGTVIGPNVQILGSSALGERVRIEGTALIQDSTIGADTILKLGVRIESSIVGAHSTVGPFAHLRPETILAEEVKIGNFVEVKKSSLLKGSKVSHLSYIGDAEIGAEANIGAGTITCNYDGSSKFRTVVGEGAFIGSNTSLVAPVEVGKGATIGAGSVITKSVSEDALALTRAEQREIANWSKKKKRSKGS